MLGWILLFGIMAIAGVIRFAIELPQPSLGSVSASLLFLFLLVLSLMTRAFRFRA